jgi:single-stranded-DNA-specific exonuclease
VEKQSLEKFMEAQRRAVKRVKDLPHRKATIVHHNDTDGISSGAILKEALRREGFKTENIPIERVHPLFLPKIHTAERKLIFYADLGSQAAEMIHRQALKGTSVIILDHHPPLQESSSPLMQVNPETFGIDGDLQASAASVTFFWATTLNKKNEDLAYLGILGAIGDHQVLAGKMSGLNQMALKTAVRAGMIRPAPGGLCSYRFPLFKGGLGSEVSQDIIDLAVNGYYQGGAQLALTFCLEGHTEESRRLASGMKEIQEERFQKEMDTICKRGVASEGHMQWVDVGERFYPLGLKSIGIFCEEISRAEWAYRDKYIVGFQDFPREIPLLGIFTGGDTKVSMRVPQVLHEDIEKGKKPHLAEILPRAAQEVGGVAEGCHRFAAACIVPQKNKMVLIRSLDRIVKDWPSSIPAESWQPCSSPPLQRPRRPQNGNAK